MLHHIRAGPLYIPSSFLPSRQTGMEGQALRGRTHA